MTGDGEQRLHGNPGFLANHTTSCSESLGFLSRNSLIFRLFSLHQDSTFHEVGSQRQRHFLVHTQGLDAIVSSVGADSLLGRFVLFGCLRWVAATVGL